MTEIEDLRNRAFAWRADRRRRECVILDGERPVGRLVLKSGWRGLYDGELAGLDWTIRSKDGVVSTDEIDFADGGRGLAKVRTGPMGGVEATIDGVARYEFRRDLPLRGVWRDDRGAAVLFLTPATNRRALGGLAQVSADCPLPHAPILLLLGLVKVVYQGYLLDGLTRSPWMVDFAYWTR